MRKGKVKINDSQDFSVEKRMIMSLFKKPYFGEETKKWLFLLRFVLLQVIHF